MAIDWSGLRDPAPGTLVRARETAHFAVQWVARAARANLPAAADDSHTALAWDAQLVALVSAPFPNGARAGLRLAPLELAVLGKGRSERLALDGRAAGMVDAWLDAALAAHGLEPASPVELPYAIPARPLADSRELAQLARWFAAAAELVGELRAKYREFRPGPGPVRCWPHHFDIAVLVGLEQGDAESSRSIGIGVSPGDEYYAQPYAYVSPYPRPVAPQLPALPPGGHWHTRDFFGAVATADALLAEREPRAALSAVIDAAFQAGRRWLDV
ncbi:MAG TPA: hypothetical protein VEH51_00345 [Burkholderiales bacterium]|nr:hypothetical protein [Burkholderiales bacterium]